MVGIFVWLLPHWGLNIPIWGLILLMLAFGVYQVVTYRLGRRAIDRKPVLSLESIVGCCGKTSTRLTPDGYVKVKGELWRAFSTGLNIDEGTEIVVMEVKRLTLLVAPALRNNRIEDVASQ
jgi:membrane-bound serine protease (ClpP class)